MATNRERQIERDQQLENLVKEVKELKKLIKALVEDKKGKK